VRTIAIINQKGGCGKTTSAINLSAVLATKGHRCLLVDMDPQSHCALGLAVPESQISRSMADLMRAGLNGSIGFEDIIWQVSRGLDLAPSAMGLASVEQQLAGAPDKDRRLSQLLSTVQQTYDFCIIDCPPSIGLLTFNALRAAAEVIVPVETGYFSLHGSIKQERTIDMLARRVGHDVTFHVLPTLYDVRTKLAREILAELKKRFGDRVLPTVINFSAKLKEAASFGQPITEYDPASRGMADFEQLADYLLAHPPTRSHRPASAQILRTADGAQPTMSRAAELVERARSLASRAAQLSSHLANDPDAQAEGLARPAAPPTPTAQPEPAAPAPTPEPAAAASDTQKLTRDQRLAKLFGIKSTQQGVLFVQPVNGSSQLAVAGDFNDWKPAPMTQDQTLGVWQTCLQIPPGRYRYRLVVDGQWLPDPFNQQTETNPYGELNNILELT